VYEFCRLDLLACLTQTYKVSRAYLVDSGNSDPGPFNTYSSFASCEWMRLPMAIATGTCKGKWLPKGGLRRNRYQKGKDQENSWVPKTLISKIQEQHCCYTSLFCGGYLQQVTDSLLTITFLSLIGVVIAKSYDSYLATSIARLLEDSRVYSPERVIDKRSCIESKVYERT